MKRIVIFIDGTRNKPDAEHPTNVVRLAQSVKASARGGMKQVVLYSTGVGSGQGSTAVARQIDLVFGGALGWGLDAIIVNAYRELMFVYEPGDEIMVFGFSRGAFAARSLVGLIRNCGILQRSSLAYVPDAMARYRSMASTDAPDSDETHQFRLDHSPAITVNDAERTWRVEEAKVSVADIVPLRIAYMGLWDTVSAMGLPEILPISRWTNKEFRFHDTKLTSLLEAARHAISIDERRRLYPSYPWTNSELLNKKMQRRLKPTILQQFFPGNHGSVGGGGEITGLSAIAMNWVLLGAIEAGLDVDFQTLDAQNQHFDAAAPLINRLRDQLKEANGIKLPFLRGDREGPKALEEVSMAVVDRYFEDPTYLDRHGLKHVRAELEQMTPEQRDNMRKARTWVDGALTHMPGQATRPRHPLEDLDE